MKKTLYIAIVALLLLVVVLFLTINPLKKGADSGPKYVFLITLDTTRADHVDYSMSRNTLTPNLAELAREGIIFSNAYSLIPITLPSHASIFYSQPPHLLRIYNNKQVNKNTQPSIAQLFKQHGYQTGAVISLGVLNTHFGLSRGFDRYIENFRPDVWYKTAEEVNRDAYQMVDEMAGQKSFFWIHYSDPHAPYFPPYFEGDFTIYFNGNEIHTIKSIDQSMVKLQLDIRPGINVLDMTTEYPRLISDEPPVRIKGISFMNYSHFTGATEKELSIRLPENWKEIHPHGKTHYLCNQKQSKMIINNKTDRQQKVFIQFNYKISLQFRASQRLYRKEVQYMDKHIGRFIEFLEERKILRDAVVIVMGDHGEGLGEHRRCVGHIHYLNKLYLHVPLFVTGKGIKRRAQPNHNLVSNLDIAPTLLDIIGEDKPDHMLGTSLFKDHHSDQLLLETYSPEAYSDGFSLIKYPYQIIYYPESEEQKFEFINLENDPMGINDLFDLGIHGKTKAELLNAIIKLSKTMTKMKEKPDDISPEQLEILKSLGYL